jgi:ATP-binding protein involved in chromosome partitioning
MNSVSPTTEEIRAVLSEVKDPESGRSVIAGKQIQELQSNGNDIYVKVGLTSFSAPLWQDVRDQVRQALLTKFAASNPTVEIAEHVRRPQPMGQVGLTSKAVIAVGSGKGGVGKSTVAVGLALTLHRCGCQVGLMDADVYGPSIPHLTGVSGEIEKQGDKIRPLHYDGMPIMSIGFMVPPDQAVIWRGPMLHSAVTTFVRDVAWGDLDFLIVDMPPGTGDVALSLSQLLPISGAIVVCTPQQVALIDAIKAVAMFEKVKIPILGIVENMSCFICPDNGLSYEIFGKGGARDYAEQAKLSFLGEIPINIQLRQRGDAGLMAENLDDPIVAPYLNRIAYQLSKNLAQRAASSPVVAKLPVLG